MLPGHRVWAVAFAALGAIALARDGKAEGEETDRVEAAARARLKQRLEALRSRAAALQRAQDGLLDKLQRTARAEAQPRKLHGTAAAASSSGKGALARGAEGEAAAARSALGERMENYVNALKAEQHFLQTRGPFKAFINPFNTEGGLKYSHTLEIGKIVEERRRSISEGIDKMTPLIHPMIEASDKYKHDTLVLHHGVTAFETKALPEFFKKARQEKKDEIHELEMMNLNDAYTPRMRTVAEWAQPKDIRWVKAAHLRQDRNESLPPMAARTPFSFGRDPYEKLSNTHWEHSDYTPWQRDVESIHINMPPLMKEREKRLKIESEQSPQDGRWLSKETLGELAHKAGETIL